MSSRTLRLVAIASVLVAAAGVAFVAWPERSRDRHAARPTSAPHIAWTPGDTRAYALCVGITSRIEQPGLPPRVAEQRYAGTLHMRVFGGVDPVLVGFQILDLRFSAGDGTVGKRTDRMDSPPFWVFFHRTGEIRETIFPEEVPASMRKTLGETIRTFQCIVPADAGVSWKTRESHATGRFRAKYALTLQGDIHKKKTGYESPDIDLVRSGGVFELSETSWLRRAVVRDRFTIRSDERSSAKCRFVAELSASTPGDRGTPPALRMTEGEALMTAANLRRAPPPEASRKASPKYTEKDVQRTMLALQASDGVSSEMTRKLGREIASDAKHIRPVLEALEAEDTTEGTAAAMINALSMAGTDEALNALGSIVRDRGYRHANRRRAIIALGLCYEPNESAMAALWETAAERSAGASRELSNTALLAIGSATGTLRERGSGAYVAHRVRLVRRVGQSTTGLEKEIVLKALGNTKDLFVSKEIVRHLDAEEQGIRKSAAYSLRLMRDPGVAERLAERLDKEPDIAVRHAVAASLNQQGAASPRALARAHAQVKIETDEAARFELVEYLARNTGQVPGWRETFQALLRVERSSRIRKRLGTALYVTKDSKRKDG